MKKALITIAMILAMQITVQARYDEQPVKLSEDGELLARLITAEAGSDWCSDEMMYGVGSVVLNRVDHEYFPDTIYDVIHQSGQYSCVSSGSIKRKPCERAKRIAADLMENGSVMPENVVFQSQAVQGEIYQQIQNMYFCIK